jgi:two-component system LytT family response regulator
MSLKGYIIDDESAPRIILKHLLEQIEPKVEIVGESDNLIDGTQAIANLNIDILFLDIEMPKHKGLEINRLISYPINFDIVFVTAYSEYAIQAFKLSAFDYLLKPLKKIELKDTLERLNNKRQQKEQIKEQLDVLDHNLKTAKSQQYFVKTHREDFIINVRDIICLEADGMYTNIVLKEEKITASKPMKEILADLPNCFFRTHRSFAINLNQVEKPVRMNGSGIKTTIGTYVPLSSRNKPSFLSSIEKLK